MAAACSIGAFAQAKVGEAAPDFEIAKPSGETVSLSSMGARSGKAVFLHFWATWCPPCREELPEIDRLAKRLAARKESRLAVFAVCVSDEEASRAAFMEKNGYTFDGALDTADSKTARLYNARAIPTSVLIGADGKIEKIHTGRMTAAELSKFVEGYED